MGKEFKIEKKYMIFLAIISLWIVHKLVNHNHDYDLIESITGDDDKQNTMGDNPKIGTALNNLNAGSSILVVFLFLLGLISTLVPLIIFGRWIYLEIKCHNGIFD